MFLGSSGDQNSAASGLQNTKQVSTWGKVKTCFSFQSREPEIKSMHNKNNYDRMTSSNGWEMMAHSINASGSP